MPIPTRILAFSGSARRESLNRRFLAVAVEEARQEGCEVTLVELGELALPIFNGDLEDEQGLPPGARKLAGLIASHSGLLVASPEYNAMPTPLLKNTLDWCSRVEPNPFEGRVAAVISASPGSLGGVRSLVLAQQLLTKLGCQVVPGQCFLPGAGKAFDPSGRLTSEHSLKSLKALVSKLAWTASRLGSSAT
jgi:NAD(P)H-dependent FMN reductase